MNADLHTVHVRVNDAATGQPTPVRIRFTDREGTYYAPFGRLARFPPSLVEDDGGNVVQITPACRSEEWLRRLRGLTPLVGRQQSVGVEIPFAPQSYAYIDGTCEINLPAGPLTVEICKGFEYRPIRQEVHLAPGKLALRFAIERWTDARSQGWYSGDIRAHALTPHGALLEGAAEDLAVVNLLARVEDSGQVSNIVAFSGQQPCLDRPGHLVVVNTFNAHRVLGGLALLNCHRVVYPLRSGWDERDDWTLAEWCDQCHRKGGLVVWCGDPRFGQADAHDLAEGEGIADLVLGKVDAVEAVDVTSNDPELQPDVRRLLLQCGLRVTPVAGGKKDSHEKVLGALRTYAHLQPGEPFSYKSWIEAVRAGRTIITDGPLLTLEVHGQEPGATVDLPAPGTVRIRAEAKCLLPVHSLEILFNGQVVHQERPATPGPTLATEVELPIPASGWLVALCGAFCDDVPPGRGSWGASAETAPVYLRVGGQPMRPDPQAVAWVLNHFDKTLTWAQTKARFPTDRQRERLLSILQSAREELQRRAASP